MIRASTVRPPGARGETGKGGFRGAFLFLPVSTPAEQEDRQPRSPVVSADESGRKFKPLYIHGSRLEEDFEADTIIAVKDVWKKLSPPNVPPSVGAFGTNPASPVSCDFICSFNGPGFPALSAREKWFVIPSAGFRQRNTCRSPAVCLIAQVGKSDTSSANVVPSGGHLPQLDGLRGIAILAVAFHHFGVHPPPWLDWGPVGPSIFFVLSGYLITLSLWKLQAARRENPPGFGWLLAGFHARRIGRLLPVIAILLLVGLVAGLPEYREGWAWCLTFTANLLLVFHNGWIGGLSHFWSLSMQEQFYLLWPLVLLVPRTYFVHAMLATVASAAVFRFVCIEEGAPDFVRWFLLPGSLDAFATGGLVAWLVRHRRAGFVLSRTWAIPIGFAAFASLAFSRYLRFLPDTHPGTAAVEIFEYFFFGWLLILLVEAPQSRLSKMLGFRPLVFVGTVSYGVFVFHTLVGILFSGFLKSAGLAGFPSPLGRAVLFSLASVAVAAASWYAVEKPLNRRVRSWEFDPALLGNALGVLERGCRRVAAFFSGMRPSGIREPVHVVLRRPGLAVFGGAFACVFFLSALDLFDGPDDALSGASPDMEFSLASHSGNHPALVRNTLIPGVEGSGDAVL